MKKSVLLIFLGLFLIKFTSAYYGSFGNLSFRNLLNSIDPRSMTLALLFLIFFAFLNFVLSRIFRDRYGNPNRATAGIIALCIALLAVYGVNRSSWEIQNLFFNIGIPSNLIYIIIFISLLAAIAFIVWKFAKNSLFVIGGLLILASIFMYEKAIPIVLGTILIIIRFFIPKDKWKMKEKRKREWRYYS